MCMGKRSCECRSVGVRTRIQGQWRGKGKKCSRTDMQLVQKWSGKEGRNHRTSLPDQPQQHLSVSSYKDPRSLGPYYGSLFPITFSSYCTSLKYGSSALLQNPNILGVKGERNNLTWQRKNSTQTFADTSGLFIPLLYPLSQTFPIGRFWAARLIAQLAGEQATRFPEVPAAPPLLLSGLPLEATYPTLIKMFPTQVLQWLQSANFRRFTLDWYQSKWEEEAFKNWRKKAKQWWGGEISEMLSPWAARLPFRPKSIGPQR